jgi:hypothetical protein
LTLVERWEKFVAGSLLASAIVLYLQIPHTISAADCFFSLGLGIVHYHPILDFFLYSIDLLEIIPIIGVTSSLIVFIKKRRQK